MELKHRLCSTPVLSLLDLHQPFEIETNALDYAVGANLTQHGHLVANHSDTLSDAIRNIPPMIRRWIPLYKPTDNGSITFSKRR